MATLQRYHVYDGCPSDSPDLAFFGRADAERAAAERSLAVSDSVWVVDSDDGATLAIFDRGQRAPIDWEAP